VDLNKFLVYPKLGGLDKIIELYLLFIILTHSHWLRDIIFLCTLQLQAPSDSAGLPSLPEPKQTLEATLEADVGTILPVPRGIRPTLAKYR
jgi:hypothetical protein